LAVTAQFTLVPELEADAQATFEVTGAAGQSRGKGTNTMTPDEAEASTFMVLVVSL
jgi:hypothetical protein